MSLQSHINCLYIDDGVGLTGFFAKNYYPHFQEVMVYGIPHPLFLPAEAVLRTAFTTPTPLQINILKYFCKNFFLLEYLPDPDLETY